MQNILWGWIKVNRHLVSIHQIGDCFFVEFIFDFLLIFNKAVRYLVNLFFLFGFVVFKNLIGVRTHFQVAESINFADQQLNYEVKFVNFEKLFFLLVVSVIFPN